MSSFVHHWHFRKRRIAAIAAAWFALAILLAGCGGKSKPAADDDVAKVDPRFASAEALLDYYNSLTTSTPVNAASLVPLFRAENDKQRRYIGIMRNMVSVAELDYNIFKTFGETLNPAKKKPMLSPSKPATFTKRESERAEADQEDEDGKTSKIYFVHADDRWWVSGFTIEYDQDFMKDIGSSPDLDKYEQLMRDYAGAAGPVMRASLTGQIQSAGQARSMFATELARIVSSHR